MKINRIKENDIVNGFGIMMSIWTQGCPHHCKGCFNVETWSFSEGTEFTEEILDYIIKNIDKHNVKRELSILGGEPLCKENVEGVIRICKSFKKAYPNKKVYVWTGYVVEDFNEIQKEIFKYADVLIDGRFEEDKKNITLALRGSSNQRIIDVKNSVKENRLVLLDLDNK